MMAITSVFRVICDKSSYGTGFLHKSGDVITAAHVVTGCNKVTIALPDNKTVLIATVLKLDAIRDLALLKPEKKIEGTPMPISSTTNLKLGSEIAFWGFPAGYIGVPPMVTVGYLTGIDGVAIAPGKLVAQWVVNGAINHGNSGGPVILVETGEIIGVADNKIAPISDAAMGALIALQNQPSGFMYTAKLPDGTTRNVSEAQVVAEVLEELRQQVQLVIGHAVLLGDLRAFLQEAKIDP